MVALRKQSQGCVSIRFDPKTQGQPTWGQLGGQCQQSSTLSILSTSKGLLAAPTHSGCPSPSQLWGSHRPVPVGFQPSVGLSSSSGPSPAPAQHMTFVQSKQTLPGEPHELLRHSANIFLLTTPHSIFPWNMNSPDTSSSYHCALTPHTGMEREMHGLAV